MEWSAVGTDEHGFNDHAEERNALQHLDRPPSASRHPSLEPGGSVSFEGAIDSNRSLDASGFVPPEDVREEVDKAEG